MTKHEPRRLGTADRADKSTAVRTDPADAGGHTAKRQSPGTGREEQIRPHPPQEDRHKTGEQP